MLLEFLGVQPEEVARCTLAMTPCLYDRFARDLVERYGRVEQLCGDDVRIFLWWLT